jgi:ATP synthase F1 delta subunit
MAVLRVAALAAVAYVAACLVSQAFVAPRPATTTRANRVAMRAESEPTGPIYVYMKALMEASAKKGESVPVTKDVMKYKATMEKPDEDLMKKMQVEITEDGHPHAFNDREVIQAQKMVALLGPWESTVFPKFVTFLAKKDRLDQLLMMCQQFVVHLYDQQSIAPVVVTSAQPLTNKQAESIKDKMKGMLKVADIKLVQKVDSVLVGGFKVEYNFLDPENPDVGINCIDLSMKRAFEDAALSEGVVMQDA